MLTEIDIYRLIRTYADDCYRFLAMHPLILENKNTSISNEFSYLDFSARTKHLVMALFAFIEKYHPLQQKDAMLFLNNFPETLHSVFQSLNGYDDPIINFHYKQSSSYHVAENIVQQYILPMVEELMRLQDYISSKNNHLSNPRTQARQRI